MSKYEPVSYSYSDALIVGFPGGDVAPSKNRVTGVSHWRSINDDCDSKKAAKLLTYPGRALDNKRRHRHGRTCR